MRCSADFLSESTENKHSAAHFLYLKYWGMPNQSKMFKLFRMFKLLHMSVHVYEIAVWLQTTLLNMT